MANAYPDKPMVASEKTTVAMADVIANLKAGALPTEVKRSVYVIFRIESGNGKSGINNNYCGAQADGNRWPPQFDPVIVGVVLEEENRTKQERLFVAFQHWSNTVDLLADRLQARGIFVGGHTHQVSNMPVTNANDLARAYHKEWVSGSANAEPDQAQKDMFTSIYTQAEQLFA